MTNKKFKIVTKSKHFIYFVTEEDNNINWCLKIAPKERFINKFKNAVIDETFGYHTILKIKLAIRHCPNYMKLNTYNNSPYKMKDLEIKYKKEIKKAIINNCTKYKNEIIPYYDYAVVLWEELNDKEKFYCYETPKQELAWTTVPLSKKETGLDMNVELVLQSIGKIENQPPYILVQNDYKDGRNLNWIKMRLDGTVINDVKPVFEDYELEDLKIWIEINKLPILMYWTQEEIGTPEILKLIKTLEVITPNYRIDSKKWENKSTKIISATELENYFDKIKSKIVGKTIDRIFYTNILYNANWDLRYDYKNGEFTNGEEKCNLPGYYQWKYCNTALQLDSPVILQFGDFKLEMQYWSGSLVYVNNNTIDTGKYGADVSKHFAVNIIGRKLKDIQIHKTKEVYFMNFEHLNIARKNGDDMFEEIWFIFENGWQLELTTDTIDYTWFREMC